MAMTWVDNQGRSWSCRVTIEDAKRLKSTGCDIADPKAFEAAFASSLAQLEVFAELMRPQWERIGLQYDQFVELMIETDDRIAQVQSAFVAGITDFFRRLGEPWMAAVAEKAWKAAARLGEARLARTSSLDPVVEKAIAQEDRESRKALADLEAKLFGS